MARPARFIPALSILPVVGLGMGLCAAPADAQIRIQTGSELENQPERPSGARRLVRRFDFEESGFNPLPVPVGWIRAQHDPSVPRIRPAFPIWNQAFLDQKSPSYAGTTALCMPIDGGSTSLRLLPGAIGVFPGTDYLITTKIRTDGLVHARACIAARLLDGQGNPLPATESVSQPIKTMGEWAEISTVVSGLDERAAYLQIELLALQPKQLPGADPNRAFAVWREDYNANAWFDDIEVTLLPRIELDTGTPGHAFGPDETPELSMLVRDLTGETLSGVLRVLDADRNVVSVQELRSASGKLSESRVPELPGPGWYRAVLDVASGNEVVGRGVLDFVWGAPEDARDEPGRMFTISADATDGMRAAALPAIIRWSNAAQASVGVWDEWFTSEQATLDGNPAFDAIRAIMAEGIGVTIRAGEAPRQLATSVGRDPWDVPGVFGADEALWMPWLEGALDRFGQGVITWQLGEHALYTDANMLESQLASAHAVFNRWVPGPELRTPWPIGDGFDPALLAPGRGVVLRDDGAGDDASTADRIRAWALERAASHNERAGGLSVEFPATAGQPAGSHDIGRTARRVVNAWVAAHEEAVQDRVELALRDPWRSTGGRRPSMMPAPELALWRTLASVLGNRSGVRVVDLLPGVRTILLGNDDDAVLIAWLTDPDAPSRVIELPLGGTGDRAPVRQVGLLGERTELTPSEDPRWGSMVHRVDLTREPVIIEGVDAPYLTLLASVRFVPDRLEPILGERTHELEIANPFATPVRGKVFIVEPGGLSNGFAGRDRSWQIAPRVVPFTIPANDTFRIPVDVLFGAAQRTGQIPAVFDVQVSGEKEYPTARVSRWIPIESDTVRIEAAAVRSGDDVIVHAFVTNMGDEPRSADLVAYAPGSARERSSVRGISPGATVERRFIVRSVGVGQSVSVSLVEPRTGERLLTVVNAE